MKIAILIALSDAKSRYALESHAELLFPGHEVAVTAVDNGNEAVALILTRIISLVITEESLPGINGMDVVREAMSNPNQPAVVFIAKNEDEEQEALRAGADRVLRLPFAGLDLRRVIDSLGPLGQP